MLIRRVVGDQLNDNAQPAAVCFGDQRPHVVQRAVIGMDGEEIRDVIAIVSQRRGEDGQHPDRVHAQPLEVVQLAGQAGQVADAVAVAVGIGPDENLVEDGVTVPERISCHSGFEISRYWYLLNSSGNRSLWPVS